MNKVLFILKRREDFNPDKHTKLGLSTGLFNSATFVKNMLNDVEIEANLEVVIDNNDIDREVTKYRPSHVIIEALWVVPSKFVILSKLHPNVTWIIRLHSEMPFLANEGMALDWLGDYAAFPNIVIGVNAPRALEEVRFLLSYKMKWDEETLNKRVIYLPNFYPQEYLTKEYNTNKDYIDIGCFGAVRPLKNHVIQAIAALKFATTIGKKLNFHINSGRVEMKGEPILNNLEGLFSHVADDDGHQLIRHEWTPREKFLKICASMDIGLQVSFSETFNIVGADIISQGVPLVGSIEIPWADADFCARATETQEIYEMLLKTHNSAKLNVDNQQKLLTEYTSKTREIWKEYFS